MLDALLIHAIDAREETYSAPLAYRSFQKKTVMVDGKEQREFPRLLFGGAQLSQPQQQWLPDLARRSAAGVGGGLAVGALAAQVRVAATANRAAATRLASPAAPASPAASVARCAISPRAAPTCRGARF